MLGVKKFNMHRLKVGLGMLILISVLATVVSCNNSVRSLQKSTEVDFEDGIYLIERRGDTDEETLPLAANERRIEFNQEFIDKTDQDAKYIVINVDEFAPLELREHPEAQDQEDGRKLLWLSLSDRAKVQLTDFTTRHLNQLTTIVVNGEALTMHKIRSVIDGGYLQITRCTDNACEMLYVELQDNVVVE